MAHIHGWHIQVHSLHKMLQGQNHVSLGEGNDQWEVDTETKKNEKEGEGRHRADLWSEQESETVLQENSGWTSLRQKVVAARQWQRASQLRGKEGCLEMVRSVIT